MMFRVMYGKSGIPLRIKKAQVGDFLVTKIDVVTKEKIKNKRDYLKHFLEKEEYMQVDIPSQSYGGLKSFATRLYGDPEEY